MEPLDNKFQKSQKDAGVKTQQGVFSIEKQAVNNNPRQQANKNKSAPMPELKKGSQGEMVKEAQRILKSTSDYIGYVDGDFGCIMEAALKSFQRRSKLPVTGIIDNATWEALNQKRR